jgi:hypothetical protein
MLKRLAMLGLFGALAGGWPILSLLFVHLTHTLWVPHPSRSLRRVGFTQLTSQFPSPSRPLRLNLHRPYFPQRVVPETRPRPVLRSFHESTFHRVPVHVSQLLSGLIRHIEVVVAPLPELRLPSTFQLFRGQLLQHLQRSRKRPDARLAYQQMNMLRHEYVPGNHEVIALPRSLKLVLEDGVSPMRG